MVNNCRVTYVKLDTGESWEEEFHDPYIFLIGDDVFAWNGAHWTHSVSYAGKPIKDKLTRVQPKNNEDPPPGFKRL